MKTHFTVFTLVVLFGSLRVSAAPVLATVANAKGNVTTTQPTGKHRPVRAGDHLSEGTTVTTDAKSEVTLTPVPGSSIWLGEKGSVTLELLQFAHDGEHIQSREAVLRINNGTIFFGLEKGNSTAGKLEIITPFGAVTTGAGAGTVGMRNGSLQVVIQNGSITFGSSVASAATLTAGCILTANSEGAQVTNLISCTVSTYDAAGNFTMQRNVAAAELSAARSMFESQIAIAAQAVGASSLSSSFISSMTEALTQVNQALAAAGLQPVDAQAVGATSAQSGAGTAAGGSGSFQPSSFSFSTYYGAGTISPTNLSGHRHSPER